MPSEALLRKVDRVLAVLFVLVAVNGFVLSLPEALGVPVAPDSPWPPLRALHGWAVTQEPAHLHIPPNLRASLLFDAFVQGPFALVAAFALWSGRRWLRTPGLLYAGAAIVNMYFYFFQTVFGPDPPLQPATYWPMNLPWLFLPIALAMRLWTMPER
jgi:hypothetical protein